MRRVWDRITGAVGTPWCSAITTASTGEVGTTARKFATRLPPKIRRCRRATSIAAISTQRLTAISRGAVARSACSASGVKCAPTKVATVICPKGRIRVGTRSVNSPEAVAAAVRTSGPIIQGSGAPSRDIR